MSATRMPNYLLQWEAMRWAKAQGYAVYDMWGAPDDSTKPTRCGAFTSSSADFAGR